MRASPLPSFEEMVRLAQEHPADFERMRATLVEDFIAHAPHRLERRLRGLQFRIDSNRRLAKSDYGAAMRVFAMMWESFESLAALWRGLPAELQGKASAPSRSAEIRRLPAPERRAETDPTADDPTRS